MMKKEKDGLPNPLSKFKEVSWTNNVTSIMKLLGKLMIHIYYKEY